MIINRTNIKDAPMIIFQAQRFDAKKQAIVLWAL